MKFFDNVDPVTNPFNDFFKNYGMWIAIIIAGVVLLVVALLFSLSSRKKSKEPVEQKNVIINSNNIIASLGGKENIESTSLTGSRISVNLKDSNIVNESELKLNGVKSLIKMSNKITLLVEGDPKEFYTRVFKNNEL